MVIHLYEAVQDIIEQLEIQSDPADNKTSVWNKVISQISERDYLDSSYCDIIEKFISVYLDKLDDDSKRHLWTETETGGWNSHLAVQDIHIDSIEMDLEVELLDEITRYAWDETGR